MALNRISEIASIVGVILGIVSLITSSPSAKSWLLGGIIIVLLFLCFYSYYQRHCEHRYLDGEAKVRNLHNEMMLDCKKVMQKNFDGIIHSLTIFCSKISEAFETIHGEKIGVCVKFVNGDFDNLYVRTLCRDFNSINTGRQEEDGEQEKDYLLRNSDFEHIFNQLKKYKKDYHKLYFCGNRLANRHQYNNTHLVNADSLPSGLLSYYKRRKAWPLPYKSTIVVPILAPDGESIEAFLCIDSPASNGFVESKDVVILQQIALFMQPLIQFVCKTHLKQ